MSKPVNKLLRRLFYALWLKPTVKQLFKYYGFSHISFWFKQLFFTAICLLKPNCTGYQLIY